eukprot:SAG31_NODE_14157_length_824_cov_1.220690_1_plen_274_part_11
MVCDFENMNIALKASIDLNGRLTSKMHERGNQLDRYEQVLQEIAQVVTKFCLKNSVPLMSESNIAHHIETVLSWALSHCTEAAGPQSVRQTENISASKAKSAAEPRVTFSPDTSYTAADTPSCPPNADRQTASPTREVWDFLGLSDSKQLLHDAGCNRIIFSDHVELGNKKGQQQRVFAIADRALVEILPKSTQSTWHVVLQRPIATLTGVISNSCDERELLVCCDEKELLVDPSSCPCWLLRLQGHGNVSAGRKRAQLVSMLREKYQEWTHGK